MDFINPKKRRYHRLRLIIGYILVSIMILLMALVLLYQSRGYGFSKGQIIQNGLVFVSSAPKPAFITLNSVLNGSTTNTRLTLPAGQYTVELTKTGYNPWIRVIDVDGGSVEYFDYPFLFPKTIATTMTRQFSTQPEVFTQSPDKHWLLVQDPTTQGSFLQYDLSNPSKMAASETAINLPDGLITSPATGAQTWQVISWADDNQRVLLNHTYQGGQEYILLDRQTPADSLNLTKSLNLNQTDQLTLLNNKYNQYYIYDTAAGTVSSENLSSLTPTLVMSHVLAFNSYGGNTITYVTNQNAPVGDVNVDVMQGGVNYVLRQFPANLTYLLDSTQYAGNWYIAAAATTDNEVYVYENPMSELSNNPQQPLVPAYILKVIAPNYLSFSENSQFVVAENGPTFSVYDAQNQKGYSYQLTTAVSNSEHAYWMDGDHLYVTTNNQVSVFDYDGTNQQTLQPIIAGSLVTFDPTYKWAYALAPTPVSASTPATSLPFELTTTALRIPADQ